MYRKVVLSIILIVALIGSGAGISYVLVLTRQAPPRTKTVALPPLVEAIRVRVRDVRESFVGYGSVAPDRSATLSAEVAAAVVELVADLEAGDAVEENQLLIRLDDRTYRRDLEGAIALVEVDDAQLAELRVEGEGLRTLRATADEEVRIAGDERRRVSDLFERGQANKREFDLARLVYQQALRVQQTFAKDLAVLGEREKRIAASRRSREAAVGMARLSVERCEIRAAFAGRIDVVFVDIGDFARLGDPMVRLIDPSHVEVAVQLPTSVHGLIKVGAACRLESEGSDARSWTGTVARLAPVADERMRTFAAYVEVDNTTQPQPLLPGAFVRAVVEGPLRQRAILIPRGAIRRGHVLIAVDGKARRVKITVDRLLADEALVRGEIAGGDVLITSHLDSLTDMAPVRLPPEIAVAAPDDARRATEEASP